MDLVAAVAVGLALASIVWAVTLRRRLAAGGREGTGTARDPRGTSGAGAGGDGDGAGELGLPPGEMQRILDAVTDAFFHVDQDWRFTYLNRSANILLARLGRTPEELLGQRLWDAFPTPEEAPGRAHLEEAMAEGTVVTHVTRHEPLDAWLEIRAFPSPDGGLSVYLRDVSEQRLAEEALRESKERFRTMVEHAPEAVVVIDVDEGRVVEHNQNAVELFGREEEELRSTIPYQFSPPIQPDGRPSVEKARELVQRALDGESSVFEWVHLTVDGKEIVTEVRLVRLPARDRRLVRGSVTDITDRKRAEEALRESEERYRALFEDDVAGNFVTSVDGTLWACNRAFAHMFGFQSAAAALGFNVYDLYPDEESRDEVLELVRDERTVEYREVEARRVDGSPLHLIENVRGVFDEEGRLVELRGHLIDVTEKKTLEEQLQQAQKLEAVGRLAGGIAHDFNNLLTTVTGHTDLLLLDRDLPPRVRDDLRRIKRAAGRAAKLTGQLLAFSRRQVLQPELVRMNDVVHDVAEMLDRVIGEDVRLRTVTHPGVPEVLADTGQLQQVVMNLALNARDAMPGGGELTLATGSTEIAAEGGDAPPGRYALLEVRDTGHGIPEEQQDKIFEPFFTTKDPGKGTGLGLAMVYGIVRQSGGHVEVRSQEGEGATFRVLLPRAEGEERRPDRAAAREGAGVDEATILVLQHDPAVRNLLRRILSRVGHRVLEAETVDDAAAYLREWQEPIHLVVADAVTGGSGAPDLRDLVRSHRGGVPLLETVAGAEGDGDHAPPREILRTPFAPTDLTRRVRALLGGAPEAGPTGPRSEERANMGS